MNNWSIVVSSVNLKTNDMSSIISNFYIDMQGNCFPCFEWTDFTGTIIQWWTNEMLSIEDKDTHRTKLMFMDGPFYLNVAKDACKKLTIQCIDSRNNHETSVYEFSCDYIEFLYNLILALKNYMRILKSMGLWVGSNRSLYTEAEQKLSNVIKRNRN